MGNTHIFTSKRYVQANANGHVTRDTRVGSGPEYDQVHYQQATMAGYTYIKVTREGDEWKGSATHRHIRNALFAHTEDIRVPTLQAQLSEEALSVEDAVARLQQAPDWMSTDRLPAARAYFARQATAPTAEQRVQLKRALGEDYPKLASDLLDRST